MSSILWVLNKKYEGEIKDEFDNAWIFSPKLWDVLSDKYLFSRGLNLPFDYANKSVLGMKGIEVFKKLIDKMNECENMTDRICWEFSTATVFYTKDKQFISDCIRNFAKDNKSYCLVENKSPVKNGRKYVSCLKVESIANRFYEIADAILQIDEKKYPFFFFQSNTITSLTHWFQNYNEDEDEWFDCSLKEKKGQVCDFAVIENNKIKQFISNLDFTYDISI